MTKKAKKTPAAKDVAGLLELMMNAEASLMAATYGGPHAATNLQTGIARFRKARKRCRQLLTALDSSEDFAGSHVREHREASRERNRARNSVVGEGQSVVVETPKGWRSVAGEGPFVVIETPRGWQCYLDNDEKREHPIGCPWKNKGMSEAFSAAIIERIRGGDRS